MRRFIFISLFFLSCNQSKNANSDTDAGEHYDLENSSIIIFDDANQYNLSRCQVRKSNDTIYMNFSDTVKHSNWYELQIIKVNNRFFSNCYNTFTITDSSYKPPILTTYHQIIKLDKPFYKIGDSITGNVYLDISYYNRWPEDFTDTIKILGDFRAIVQ